MKTLEDIIIELETQIEGTRKLLAEIKADRIQREQTYNPAVIPEDNLVETL